MRVVCLALAAAICGCAGSGFGGDPPYRFRQSLIDPEAETAAPSPRASPAARRAPARCRELVGRELPGGALELVRRCTGVALRGIPRPEPLSLRGVPELLDLALFRPDRTGSVELGVVVARSGPRIELVVFRGGRGRLVVLNTAQPHRRRLPGSRRVENSYLRVIQRDDPPGTRYLAGELLEGFVANPL